ncbi:hypothetical protein D3C71_939670 [compost metagenome]
MGEFDLGVVAARRPQTFGERRGAVAGVPTRMQHKGDEKLVDPEPPAGDPIVVQGAQLAREGGAEAGGSLQFDRAPHDMVPDRQAVVGEIAPGLVELDVPVVEVSGVGGLETGPVDLKHHHQGAAVERDHMVRDVPGVGQVRPGVGLAP